MKKMNKTMKILAVIMLLAIAVTGCSKKPEGVVATVNGTNIAEEEFIAKYSAAKKAIIASYGEEMLLEPSPEDPKETMEVVLKKNVLNNLVQMEIVRQDAEKNDIRVDAASLEEQINQAKGVYGGDEGFKKALSDQGIDEAYFKNYLAESMLMQQYSEKKMSELTPSEEEIKAEFEKNKDKYSEVDASHILVETEEEAKEIKKQLDGGADFATLAKEKSKDDGTKEKGGNLGYFRKGDMVQEFEKAAFALKKGETGEPVKTNFGFHIIKLNDVRSDFESSKDLVKQTMVNERFRTFLEKLEKDSKIKKYLDYKEEIKLPGETETPVKEEATPKGGANAEKPAEKPAEKAAPANGSAETESKN